MQRLANIHSLSCVTGKKKIWPLLKRAVVLSGKLKFQLVKVGGENADKKELVKDGSWGCTIQVFGKE